MIGMHAGATGPASADVTTAGAMTPQELAKRCGLVFQFPERYFLGGTLQEVVVQALPLSPSPLKLRHAHARPVCVCKPSGTCTICAVLAGHQRQRCAVSVRLVHGQLFHLHCCHTCCLLPNIALLCICVQPPLLVLQEIVFGWPFNEYERQAYSAQAHRVLEAVGLKPIPVQTPLQQLSGGYKRRVALAVQLVRRPAVRSTAPVIAVMLLLHHKSCTQPFSYVHIQAQALSCMAV